MMACAPRACQRAIGAIGAATRTPPIARDRAEPDSAPALCVRRTGAAAAYPRGMEKLTCRLCRRRRLTDDDRRAGEFCRRCREDYDAASLGPVQRPHGPCRRCQFAQLVRVRLRQQVGELRTLAPLAAAFPLAESRLHTAPDRTAPIGVFEAYVCRACGFTELYCTDPGAIPIGPEHGTELVDAGGDRVAG